MRKFGDRLSQGNQFGNLGFLADDTGDVETARGLLRKAVALYQAAGVGGEGSRMAAEALKRLEASPAED